MFPGPFSIAKVRPQKNSDDFDFIGLSFGFNTLAQAAAACVATAKEGKLDINDLVVLRSYFYHDGFFETEAEVSPSPVTRKSSKKAATSQRAAKKGRKARAAKAPAKGGKS